jgi:preprotein translocase subunit SecG
MLTLLAIVHVLIGIGLIMFVLLQDPKGGAMGVFSGGSSSNTFFGASGATNFLTTTTRWLAILFAISCLTLTYLTARRGNSVMDSYVPPAGATAPAAPAADGAPATAPPVEKAAPAPESPTK